MTIRIVQRITDAGLKLVGILLAWLGLTVALPLALREGAQVDVYFPSQHLLTNLPDDVSVVDWGRNRITLTGERRDLALSLYRAGAMIVLPSGGGGCVDLRKKRSS